MSRLLSETRKNKHNGFAEGLRFASVIFYDMSHGDMLSCATTFVKEVVRPAKASPKDDVVEAPLVLR
jgi:hypothetical protein